MRILKQDAQQGILRLRLDSPDDLWHLAQLVRAGDVVSGVGHREPLAAKNASTASGGGGKVEKKAMWLGVRVESVEFQEFSTRLRVLGLLVEGPQDLGQHHTLSYEAGDEVELRKIRWPEHDLLRVKEAVDATKRPLVVVLAIEDNEAVVAGLRHYGVQRLADVTGHAAGKRYGTDEKAAKTAFFEEVLLALRQNRKTGAGAAAGAGGGASDKGEGEREGAAAMPLLVVGPGFVREEFLAWAKAKEPDTVKGALTEGTGQAGMAGVHEALKRGLVERAQKDQRVSFETRLVERALEAIATDAPVAYGEAEVRRMLDLGAVETLLVTDASLRDGPAGALLEAARATGAAAHVISTFHDAGKRLAGLGGIAALLRYRP